MYPVHDNSLSAIPAYVSCVPQGSLFGPLLFSIYLHYMSFSKLYLQIQPNDQTGPTSLAKCQGDINGSNHIGPYTNTLK